MPLFNKRNKREVSVVESLVANKIYVTPERFHELQGLQAEALSHAASQALPKCSVLAINLSQGLQEQLSKEEGFNLIAERISEERADRKKFARLFHPNFIVQENLAAVVVELMFDKLCTGDKRLYALGILNKLPVIAVVRNHQQVVDEAAAYSGGTWPVFDLTSYVHKTEDIVQWLNTRLPEVRCITTRIIEDLHANIQHYGEVNPTTHFLKRAAVALIPFGVFTVNMLGILRLMANIMKDVGMVSDTGAKKAMAYLGAQNAALVSAYDTIGDIYANAIMVTMLADLAGKSLVDVVNAIDVVDGVLLGSISVVTGTISAITAYQTRPLLVRSAAEFLSSLQMMYLMNPAMRRVKEEPNADEATLEKTKDKDQ